MGYFNSEVISSESLSCKALESEVPAFLEEANKGQWIADLYDKSAGTDKWYYGFVRLTISRLTLLRDQKDMFYSKEGPQVCSQLLTNLERIKTFKNKMNNKIPTKQEFVNLKIIPRLNILSAKKNLETFNENRFCKALLDKGTEWHSAISRGWDNRVEKARKERKGFYEQIIRETMNILPVIIKNQESFKVSRCKEIFLNVKGLLLWKNTKDDQIPSQKEWSDTLKFLESGGSLRQLALEKVKTTFKGSEEFYDLPENFREELETNVPPTQ